MVARIYRPARNAMQSGRGKSAGLGSGLRARGAPVHRSADGLHLLARYEAADQAALSIRSKKPKITPQREGIPYIVQPVQEPTIKRVSLSGQFPLRPQDALDPLGPGLYGDLSSDRPRRRRSCWFRTGSFGFCILAGQSERSGRGPSTLRLLHPWRFSVRWSANWSPCRWLGAVSISGRRFLSSQVAITGVPLGIWLLQSHRSRAFKLRAGHISAHLLPVDAVRRPRICPPHLRRQMG